MGAISEPSGPVVAVLAGGSGRRIGGDKATVELGGKPLIHYPLQAAREAGLPAIVVCKRATALPAVEVRVVHEPDAPSHPLCGILAALRACGGPVLAVGCDMPFIPASLLARLAATPLRVRMLATAGRLNPLPALLLPAATSPLEQALRARASLRATFEQLAPELIEAPERAIFSVNGPDDLALATRWLAR